MSLTVNGVTAVVAVGIYTVNQYLADYDTIVNDKPVRFDAQVVETIVYIAKKARRLIGFAIFLKKSR